MSSPSEGTPDQPFLDGTMLNAGHLGGYHVGGDPQSWYPDLWRWLVQALGIKSVIDVGCGEGEALRYFADLGCDVLGVEGLRQEDPRIVQHDFVEGPYVPEREFDLCWSCEFVEHVEEHFVPNFLATFASAEYIFMSHALPGQGGHHHVNCHEDDYWIGTLAGVGYTLEHHLTVISRELVPWGYYRWTGLAFRRSA